MKHIWQVEVTYGNYNSIRTYILLTATNNPAIAMRQGLGVIKKFKHVYLKQKFNKLEYMGDRDN